MYKILVYGRGFSPDPHRPFEDFENSLRQHAVPSGLRSGPWARRAAFGEFQNPLRALGIWVKIPSQKSEFPIVVGQKSPILGDL